MKAQKSGPIPSRPRFPRPLINTTLYMSDVKSHPFNTNTFDISTNNIYDMFTYTYYYYIWHIYYLYIWHVPIHLSLLHLIYLLATHLTCSHTLITTTFDISTSKTYDMFTYTYYYYILCQMDNHIHLILIHLTYLLAIHLTCSHTPSTTTLCVPNV